MNIRLLVAIPLFAAVLATTVCRKSELDVAQLPELPQEVAVYLKQVPNSDVLVSMAPIPASSPIVPPKKPDGTAFTRACSETQNFLVQVGYPVTVCTRPDLVVSSFMSPAPSSTSEPATTTTVKSFKLTAFEGKRFTTPYHCRSHHGPWLATISRTTQCNEAMSCVMVIMGVPSCPTCPTFIWSGEDCEVKNRPSQVLFVDPVFEQGAPQFSPCSSLSTCGGPDRNPSPAPPPT